MFYAALASSPGEGRMIFGVIGILIRDLNLIARGCY